MRIARILALFLLLGPLAAYGQGAIQQAGPLSAGHGLRVVTNGVAQDAGPANGGKAGSGLSELNITQYGTSTGPYDSPFCLNDGPTSGPYHQLCLTPNNGSHIGQLTWGAYNTATAEAFVCVVNGVTFNPCLGGGSGGGGNVVASGSATSGGCLVSTGTASPYGVIIETCPGGGGSPGGSNGQIQYNNAGAFGGYAAVPVANGGTGQTSAGAAAANAIGAAELGANNSITSLTGLTTALPVAEGGTGATAAGATAANNIGALARANNLSDLTSVTTAQANLGLGTAATYPIGTAGPTLCLLNGSCTFSGTDNFIGAVSFSSLPSLPLPSGELFVGNASGQAVTLPLAGDCTISNAGIITCIKTAGASFAASATTNALNATNITSGTLPAAQLPLCSASAFGGCKVDGTTITASGGVISAIGSGSGNVVASGSPVSGTCATFTGTGYNVTGIVCPNLVTQSIATSTISIGATTTYVYTTATLTAPVTAGLPAASTVPNGSKITIADPFGGVTSTNTITVGLNGSDHFNGLTAGPVLEAAYAAVTVASNGGNGWTRVSDELTTAFACPTNQFANGSNVSGPALTCVQPAFTNLSGSIANAQIPTTLTNAFSFTGTSLYFGGTSSSYSLETIAVASQVDGLQIQGSAAGTPGVVEINAAGSDTAIEIEFNSKGSAPIYFNGNAFMNSLTAYGSIETTGSVTEVQAAGTMIIQGSAAMPTFNGSSEGALTTTAADGLVIAGEGTGFDFMLQNSLGNIVFENPTGTQNISFFGSVTFLNPATGTAAKYLCLSSSNVVIAQTGAC